MTLSNQVRTCTTSDDVRAWSLGGSRRLALLLLATFGLLAVVVAEIPTPSHVERSIDRGFHATPGSAMFGMGRAVSFMGSAAVVAVASALLAAFVWKRTRHRVLAAVCLIGPALAGAAELVMKHLVGRTRPATRSLTRASGFSFPSGHTAGAAALAIVAVLITSRLTSNKRTRLLVAGVAFLYMSTVGIGRVVVGAHYGLDVVGGWLLGPAAAMIAFSAMTWRSSDPLERASSHQLRR